MHCSAAVANAAKNDTSLWLAVANAHAAFASPCELHSLMLRSAAVANAANNNASLWLGLVWFGEAGARNPAGSALRKAQRKRAQPIPPTARRGQLQG